MLRGFREVAHVVTDFPDPHARVALPDPCEEKAPAYLERVDPVPVPRERAEFLPSLEVPALHLAAGGPGEEGVAVEAEAQHRAERRRHSF